MLRNRLYYGVKPWLPQQLRLAVRRWFAIRKCQRVGRCWPILPGSEQAPEGWPGWPYGKKFALVLTHDVEGPEGLSKCRQLMELEMRLGFRSSFNFVPEGTYSVTKELREELTSNRFEVGVHDLYHDGKLYSSRASFAAKAKRINQYLKDWKAVGFRSGFMLHNLEWAHDLEVLYDASTFDTDPFEPQPDGAGTIFPFWVPRPNGAGASTGEHGSGYFELPYTLPQDSTLFLLLRENGPQTWCKKLDWIAEHGGMALVNVHPDYMRFDGEADSTETFPCRFYGQFLEYARERFGNSFWQALPREVCEFMRRDGPGGQRKSPGNGLHPNRKPKIWIDLDNTPHVPFFEPIICELRARGFPVLVTARDAFQVYGLAEKKGLECLRIGRHNGKNRLMKGCGLAYRALQLAPVVLRERPALAVSHGSRAQVLLGNLTRIPSLLLDDYEFSEYPGLMRPVRVLVPEVIPTEALTVPAAMVGHYPGIKEDVYCWKLKPEVTGIRALGIKDSDLVVTVRPPATEAHYHNPESEKFFEIFMDQACQVRDCRIVLLPRNRRQGEFIRSRWPRWFENGRTVIPSEVIDGLNLIWHSDLVVSGGGTMNREAAALGVPVFSIFRGTIGAVDNQLAREGRLKLVTSPAEAESIPLVKRVRKPIAEATSRRTLLHIVDAIVEIAESLEPQGKTGI